MSFFFFFFLFLETRRGRDPYSGFVRMYLEVVLFSCSLPVLYPVSCTFKNFTIVCTSSSEIFVEDVFPYFLFIKMSHGSALWSLLQKGLSVVL